MSNNFVFKIQNQAELQQVISCVFLIINNRYTAHNDSPNQKSVVITLVGDLGTGKTTFTKMFADKIGVKETLTSPTFVIQKSYKIPKNDYLYGFTQLIHIDAYRLDNSEDLKKLSFENLVDPNKNNLICIEWPEIVSDIIPLSHISIQFEHQEGDMRKVTVVSNL